MKLKNVFKKDTNVILGMIHLYPSKEQIEKVLGETISDSQLINISEYGFVEMSEEGISKIEAEVIDIALQDAKTLASVGVDGLIVENYDFGYEALSKAENSFDVQNGIKIPYKTHKPVKNLLHKMVKEIQKQVTIPIGVNVLTNHPLSTYSVAKEAGCQFIQLDCIIGKYNGRFEVPIETLMHLKKHYHDILTLGGVHPKYYERVMPDWAKDKKEEWLQNDLLELIGQIEKYNLAEVIVLTGDKTGGEPPKNLAFAKHNKPNLEYIAGSGIKADSVCDILNYCNGAIVGSAFKQGGVTKNNPVSYELSKSFMEQVNTKYKHGVSDKNEK
jgi:predicted TIM-barrel enzyme